MSTVSSRGLLTPAELPAEALAERIRSRAFDPMPGEGDPHEDAVRSEAVAQKRERLESVRAALAGLGWAI